MKKVFAILTVAAFVFAACGQKKVETETTEPVQEVTEQTAPAEEAPVEAGTNVAEMPVE